MGLVDEFRAAVLFGETNVGRNLGERGHPALAFAADRVAFGCVDVEECDCAGKPGLHGGAANRVTLASILVSEGFSGYSQPEMQARGTSASFSAAQTSSRGGMWYSPVTSLGGRSRPGG